MLAFQVDDFDLRRRGVVVTAVHFRGFFLLNDRAQTVAHVLDVVFDGVAVEFPQRGVRECDYCFRFLRERWLLLEKAYFLLH